MLLSLIIPVYNEHEIIRDSYERLCRVLAPLSQDSEILFIDDGSSDGTIDILRDMTEQDARIKVLSFSRNFGQMAAITAGLTAASGDAAIIIDADMQDPPELIPEMLDKWQEGYEVVYGIKSSREKDSFSKRVTAQAFYRILNKLNDLELPVDAGEFRLVDRKVIDAYNALPERNRYVRGLFAWLGFKTTGLHFTREERTAGETKYTLKRMLRLASDAFFSMSSFPFRLSRGVIFVDVLLTMLTLLCRLLLPGFTSTAALIVLLVLNSFSILLALYLQSFYTQRLYDEARGRPLYVIREVISQRREN